MNLEFVVANGKNPIPYKRTTQRAKFCKEYQKYVTYKNNVVSAFIKSFRAYPHQLLEKNKKYSVDIMIFFKDKTHGDSDNIFKGIADAIFKKPLNDKYICGSFDYQYDVKNPRVEISIRDCE